FLFIVTITAIWLGSIASAREVVKERSVFLRERAVGVSVSAYVISKVVVLFELRPLHAGGSAAVLVFLILLLTSLAAIGMGLLVSTLARSEDQSTSFIPLILIPVLLFGGSLIPLVHKGLGIRVLSGLMVSRWSFAGTGAAVHLNTSDAVLAHYGTIFSHGAALEIAIVALFAVVFIGVVAV